MRRYGVQCPFVLHLGAAAGRKNTKRLIHAWNEVHPTMRQDWQLLVVGLDRTFKSQVQDLLAQMNMTKSVILHDYADEADLPTLFSAAEVLAYPSISEGFGLPILDAWQTHTAVLSGNRTAIPEIAGNAALLVDPTRTEAIADGLKQLLEFPLCRAKFVQRGRRRLLAFSWHKTAETFVHTMEKAAALAENHSTVKLA
ncbi:MAG: glycosyltransferase [Phycisphaerae bacterium]|nr:glycosyltransferase [Phycisphaerae bacterium]